jgi:hypothetical protein
MSKHKHRQSYETQSDAKFQTTQYSEESLDESVHENESVRSMQQVSKRPSLQNANAFFPSVVPQFAEVRDYYFNYEDPILKSILEGKLTELSQDQMAILEHRYNVIEEEERRARMGPDYIGMIHKREFLPKMFETEEEMEARNEYSKLLALESDPRSKIKQAKGKLIPNALQMKDMYSPQKDFLTNKFSKRLIDNIVKDQLDEECQQPLKKFQSTGLKR